ncbi:aspartate phosphatase [Terrilactibacillus laevilacticus]|uniref:aspartate phosphatase n=1 Tax=Terrilactibacillus laevilacticus TaxID=1380157 RepID=UPI0011465290|nr:aspartate phosphatase [Terrilactibacillus laevilacticus]
MSKSTCFSRWSFKKKNIIEAISCYKKAEEKLYIVDDEIEKAEFHFRLAHFYYYIKKSYLSLNYALYAKDIYKRFPTYKQRCITCEFIIGGNLIDNTNYNEASIVLLNALKGADTLYDNMLTSLALCNLGICFLKQGSYNSAAEYLSKAINLFTDQNSTRLPKAIYNLMHVRIKQNRLVDAFNLYEKGMLYSKELEDQEYMVKLNFLKGLYLEQPINESIINETFLYLETVNKFSDMSEMALEVADFYNENKCYDKSVIYYEISRKAENNIKKGENFYEN